MLKYYWFMLRLNVWQKEDRMLLLMQLLIAFANVQDWMIWQQVCLLDFQTACFNERGWEFAGNEYCCRWADLLRFEKVESANSNRDSREYALNHTPTKADYLPIPAYDKNLNPNLHNIGN